MLSLERELYFHGDDHFSPCDIDLRTHQSVTDLIGYFSLRGDTLVSKPKKNRHQSGLIPFDPMPCLTHQPLTFHRQQILLSIYMLMVLSLPLRIPPEAVSSAVFTGFRRVQFTLINVTMLQNKMSIYTKVEKVNHCRTFCMASCCNLVFRVIHSKLNGNLAYHQGHHFILGEDCPLSTDL